MSFAALLVPLQCRTAIAALVGVVFVDWCNLPENTICGSLHPSNLGRTHCYFGAHPSLARTAEGTLVVSDDPPDGSAVISSLVYRPHYGTVGFWAPTRITDSKMLWIPSEVPAGEVATVYGLFADYLIATGDRFASDAPVLRAGGAVTTTVLPLGYLHDLVPLFCLAGLFVSLRSRRTWEPIFEARAERRARKLGSGICPTCSYALGGLPTGAACPECGDSLVDTRTY